MPSMLRQCHSRNLACHVGRYLLRFACAVSLSGSANAMSRSLRAYLVNKSCASRPATVRPAGTPYGVLPLRSKPTRISSSR
jgi:hypothetical protein